MKNDKLYSAVRSSSLQLMATVDLTIVILESINMLALLRFIYINTSQPHKKTGCRIYIYINTNRMQSFANNLYNIFILCTCGFFLLKYILILSFKTTGLKECKDV